MSQVSQEKIAVSQTSEKNVQIHFFISDGERKGKYINRSYRPQIPDFLLSCIPALS